MADNNKKRAYIAMSGGVDSAVAALLMRQSGYDCTGVTMVVGNGMNIDAPLGESGLLRDAEDAKAVCDNLGMEHKTVDLRDCFREKVINEFTCEYENGRTPNPCVTCNRCVKFGALMQLIPEDAVYATGHYARTEYDSGSGKYLLKKALDESKDQSYMLYSLTQAQLSRICFPLGKFNKSDIRRIAEENGLSVAHKHDSQDICFIPDGDYAEYILNLTGKTQSPGNFVEKSTGRILGQHKGQFNYTIGQRRGLGLSLPEPLYVGGRDIPKNEIILCTNDELFSKKLTATNVNFCSIDRPADDDRRRCQAKIRYAHKAAPATYWINGGMLHVLFDEPQRAITPGQSVVLYDGDIVLGGGVVE